MINIKELGWLDLASNESVDAIHHRMMNPGFVTPTGLPSIDQKIGMWGDRRGIPQGCYVLCGGSSNVGKTQWGLWLLMQAARTGQSAGLLSLDMRSRDAIARVLMSMTHGQIPFYQWRPSAWKDGYQTILRDAVRAWQLEEAPEGRIAITIDRTPLISEVDRKIRGLADLGATFFVVDHLQKVKVDGESDVFARAEIVSNWLEELVDELGVTIVGLSQLNRNASRERDRKPTMFDLHGGTMMEANSDIVIMLDHSRYERHPERDHIAQTYVLLEKNQMGPKDFEVPVEWNHAQLRIREGEPDEEREWPQADRRKRSA